MASTAKQSVQVVLEKAKETKGTWKYEEDDNKIRQIYLRKDLVAELGSPSNIKVTIEAY